MSCGLATLAALQEQLLLNSSVIFFCSGLQGAMCDQIMILSQELNRWGCARESEKLWSPQNNSICYTFLVRN
jgi:hypothetical protein